MSEAPASAVHDTTAPTTTTMGPDVAVSGSTTNAENAKPTEAPGLSPADGKHVEASEAIANVANAPKEEKVGKGEVLVESHPINEGVLNYKGSGLKGLIFSKKYFWFSDAPLEHKHLSAYLGNEKTKDIAHGNAAHATQTGKGLLFYAKRVEDKDHPQGILNLADMSDLAKGNFNDFSVSLHGHKHTFQALTKSERDGWLVALESKMGEAKASREAIVGSEGYKSQVEKYGKPGAAAGATGNSRSLSRQKMSSKSRERVKDATAKEATPPATAATEGTVTDNSTTAPAKTHNGTAAEQTAEAATGAAPLGAAARKSSISDEEKKTMKTEKSRSQSRNKRSSIFSGLLAKKDENDEKKVAKKAEKEEKAEDKAEHKVEKTLEKEAKHEGTGKAGEFDAAAVASRVVAEPVVPAAATGLPVGTTETAPSNGTEPATINGATSTATASGPAAPKPTKRSSVFGGLFGKKDAAPNPTTTDTPAVPAKDEPVTVSPTAPQLENPVTSPAAEPTGPTITTKTEPAAVTEATAAPTSATTPTDKRRTSFFSTLGTKKEKKPVATSGDEAIDGEAKKQGGGFSGLLRKASRAQSKRDASAPVTDAAEVPLPKEHPAGEKAITNGDSPVNKEGEHAVGKPSASEGDAGPNTIAKNGQSTAVEATA
ncbi:MAG: hypothetical protein Q9163_004347 [Psora crenata]